MINYHLGFALETELHEKIRKWEKETGLDVEDKIINLLKREFDDRNKDLIISGLYSLVDRIGFGEEDREKEILNLIDEMVGDKL